MKVLVVEDSERLRRSVQFALRKAGFTVDVSAEGNEGLWLADSGQYDALVLDRMLPGIDGIEILHRLRQANRQTPVLILTVKGSVADRVEGLRAGADDYLAKPFAMEELIARVEALIRRKYGTRQPVLRIGDLQLNTASRQVQYGEIPVALTPREYRLLELLARRTGEVVSRTEIEEHLYGEDTDLFSNAVESAISTLRRKLEEAGGSPMIWTRRGMGYVLEAR